MLRFGPEPSRLLRGSELPHLLRRTDSKTCSISENAFAVLIALISCARDFFFLFSWAVSEIKSTAQM